MRQYRYNPLFQKGQTIRVLQLLPSRDKSSVLRGKLIEYLFEDLDATNHVSEIYEALSYVWGGEQKPKSIIITDNQDDETQSSGLSITQSLHDALLRLRHCHFTRILWVDAVCIDQKNNEEKEHQIELMPVIYSRAKCVLVWLGEARDDSDMVLESIQAASRSFLQPHCDHRPTTQPLYDLRQGILKLLSRPWFSRMWILQEIGAARHVAILCGSTEIEGHAFSLGLDSLMRTWNTPFCSVTFLMRGAVFRPRRLSAKQARFSLDICSLSELIDQYRTHETTIRHDKVYALLGMSSDDTNTAGLEPNYKLAWAELSQRLVRFLLGNRVTVGTSENTGVAIIKGKGCVLGTVSSINTTQGWETEVAIDTGSNWCTPRKYIRKSISCSLPSLPKPIKRGDLVCLLEGAQKPIVIRLYKGHLAVVMIGAVFRGQSREKLLDLVQSIKDFRRDLLLTWDLGNCVVESQDAPAYDLNRSSDKSDLTCRLDDFTSLWNVALVLKDAEMEEEEKKMFGEATKRHKAILQMMNLRISPGDLSGLTPLAFAAKNGHAELAGMLLAEDENSLYLVDRDGRTPLSHAAEQGHLALVKLLLESSHLEIIPSDLDGRTPLLWAAARGQEDVVKLLLKTDRIDVNAMDIWKRTPLSHAAENGHEGVVKLLLEADKIEIKAKGNWSQTPLFKAARNGHEDVIKLLLEAGKYDVNWKDTSENRTALHAAAGFGHEGVVKLLLKVDEINVEAKDRLGQTPLLVAASCGHEAIAKMLLDKKADVNCRDEYGGTPLSCAVVSGLYVLVKMLLDKKADMNCLDESGRTPLSYAKKRGNEAILKLMREADVDSLLQSSQ